MIKNIALNYWNKESRELRDGKEKEIYIVDFKQKTKQNMMKVMKLFHYEKECSDSLILMQKH